MRELTRPLSWRDVYGEAEFYKAVVRVYTKPLFAWRKALSTSTDGKNLYDLAGRGLRSLDALHRSLARRSFAFQPAVALRYNFNGKRRTLYISPWEDRIVDLMLYRTMNRALHPWFSANSYAYRERSFGLDACQGRIARVLRETAAPLYCVKRDIADYFGSVDHELLLAKLDSLVVRDDYLHRLLRQRIEFTYRERQAEAIQTAEIGIPFGTAAACLFANIYLTGMDRAMETIGGIDYFRYADDLLAITPDREAATAAAEQLERSAAELRLRMKPSHALNLAVERISPEGHEGRTKGLVETSDDGFEFEPARAFRHLGLEFRAGGEVALSRDKCRKIRNLFRFAFRRGRRKWQREGAAEAKARALVEIALETLENGVRNVAIVDYYLKHVSDEAQLRELDRWLAEEVLSRMFGGHKKGHFRRFSFGRLRSMGLPSLVHRRRMILGGRIESPFFVWQQQKRTRAFRGTVARRERASASAFSPFPQAAANQCP